MRTTRLLLVTALALMGTCAVTASAAEAKYGFRLSPHVGTPKTTFKASFRAPRAADGDDTGYYLEAVGPPGCAQIFELSGPVKLGQPVVLRLTAADDILLPGPRRRWCRGSYVGYVYWSSLETDRLIAYFRFGVGRRPVSLH